MNRESIRLASSLAPLAPLAPLVLVALAGAQSYYIPVNLLPFANDRLQNLNANFPRGSQVLGGVPYRIEPVGNNMWLAELAGGPNPRVLEVPVNVVGVKKVHTLLSTAWGQPGPGVFAQVQFVGANGTIVTQDLVGNFNIRDWNQGAFTNTISAPNTQNVVTIGTSRIDMQTWTLPAIFETEELRRVRFIDTGNTNFQRLYVQGLTIEIDQPAPVQFNFGPGATGNFYQAFQAPQGITWQQARDFAANLEGSLTCITSAEENAFVYSLVGGNQAFWLTPNTAPQNGWGPWIGGLQQPGSAEPGAGWSWDCGEPFTYTNWALGEPNNNSPDANEDRLHFLGNNIPASNRWNDLPGIRQLRGFIVEFPGFFCNDIDINNDGSLFDPQDIEAFLSIYSEGPCIPASATCDGIDFNNDGSLFDPCDIDSFLLVFSEGPCTSCGE
jgi:hypothetical protein